MSFAEVEAASGDAALIALTLVAARTLRSGSGVGLADAGLAGLARRAIGVGCALEVAQAAQAGLTDSALRVGDTELLHHFAGAAVTDFTWGTIGRGAATQVVDTRSLALSRRSAGLPGAAVAIVGAAKSAPSTLAGRAFGAIGAGLADARLDAEAVFAALGAAGAVRIRPTLTGVVAVGRGLLSKGSSGVIEVGVGAGVGVAILTRLGARKLRVGDVGRGASGIIGGGWDTSASPADTVRALVIRGACSKALSLDTAGVSPAVGVAVTGDAAASVYAGSAGAALEVLSTGPSNDAAPFMADLSRLALKRSLALRDAVAIEATELILEATGLILAASRGRAGILVTTPRRAVDVGATGGDIGSGNTDPVAGANLRVVALGVTGAGRHALATEADACLVAREGVVTEQGTAVRSLALHLLGPLITTADAARSEPQGHSKHESHGSEGPKESSTGRVNPRVLQRGMCLHERLRSSFKSSGGDKTMRDHHRVGNLRHGKAIIVLTWLFGLAARRDIQKECMFFTGIKKGVLDNISLVKTVQRCKKSGYIFEANVVLLVADSSRSFSRGSRTIAASK